MPIEIVQASELQGRVRRLTGIVSSQLLSLDSLTQASVLLADVNAAPYRSDPKAFIARSSRDGAAGANFNGVNFALEGGSSVCALIRRISLMADEAMAAGFAFYRISTEGGFGSGVSSTDIEPLAGVTAVAPFAPNQIRGRATGINVVVANVTIFDTRVALVGTDPVTQDFIYDPPILLLGAQAANAQGLQQRSITAWIQANDGAANPVAVSANFYGEIFNLYPQR